MAKYNLLTYLLTYKTYWFPCIKYREDNLKVKNKMWISQETYEGFNISINSITNVKKFLGLLTFQRKYFLKMPLKNDFKAYCWPPTLNYTANSRQPFDGDSR